MECTYFIITSRLQPTEYHHLLTFPSFHFEDEKMSSYFFLLLSLFTCLCVGLFMLDKTCSWNTYMFVCKQQNNAFISPFFSKSVMTFSRIFANYGLISLLAALSLVEQKSDHKKICNGICQHIKTGVFTRIEHAGLALSAAILIHVDT